jgi:hypothetical protein
MSNNILFKECIHKIRNMEILNKSMINEINAMSDKEKMEIIKTFNEIMEIIKSYNE